MKNIGSYAELQDISKKESRTFLLLSKPNSEPCDCAKTKLEEIEATGSKNINLLLADVSQVRDIHEKYNITSVPSLLIFENGNYTNVVKGCQSAEFYKSLIENAAAQANRAASGKKQKSVRVYSTPTCTWCNTLKGFLRKHGIPFTDIDVSRDFQAATEMMRRSGQQGVPQTEIDGQIVVGFNQKRLQELLDIQ